MKKLTIVVNRSTVLLKKAKWNKILKEARVKLLLYLLLHVTLVTLGALLFLYIEECYDPHKPTEDENENIQRATHMLRACANTSSSFSELVTVANTMLTDWKNEYDDVVCKFNLHTFFKWLDFTYSVAFTIGKLINVRKFLCDVFTTFILIELAIKF